MEIVVCLVWIGRVERVNKEMKCQEEMAEKEAEKIGIEREIKVFL